MHYFRIPRHTQSMIAYEQKGDFIGITRWLRISGNFGSKLHCQNAVTCPMCWTEHEVTKTSWKAKHTSITELLWSFSLAFGMTGLLSTYIGLLPLFIRMNSPLFLSFIAPCRREILNDGPSNDKSTSTWLSLVVLPILICTLIEIHLKYNNIVQYNIIDNITRRYWQYNTNIIGL